MTPLSLVPEQARHLGMDYGDLVEAIIADALEDARRSPGERMASAEIKRGGNSVRKSAAAQGKARKVRKARRAPAR